MATNYTYTDAYLIVNSLLEQATGQAALTAADTGSFVSAGQQLLTRVPPEQLFGMISQQWAKTIFAVREYVSNRYKGVEVNDERFGLLNRKISYQLLGLEQSTYLNTDLAPEQLADGSAVDHYKIRKLQPFELSFVNVQTLQNHITRFLEPILNTAFRSESELLRFWDAGMLEYANQITQAIEMGREAVVLNKIGSLHYYQGLSLQGRTFEVDLVSEYNNMMGSSYTREQLLGEHAVDFAQFAAAKIKAYARFMRDRSVAYHVNPADIDTSGGYIARQTMANDMKMLFYAPYFIDLQARVYSDIFNPEYLNIGDFEEVTFWQSNSDDRASVNVTPSIMSYMTSQTTVAASGKEVASDTASGFGETLADAQSIPYVLGLLYDRDSMGINHKFQSALATPVNAAGRYVNMFWYATESKWNDPTENALLFVLGG